MGCQTQNVAIISKMANETRHRPRLTPKGERTRARIVAAAAALIYERGAAGTTLDDVRTAAEVSGSQLSHYFAGKDELVQAVIDHQADVIVGNQEQADLGTAEGIRAWRDMVIAAARSAGGKGGLAVVSDSARPSNAVSGVRRSCDSVANSELRRRSDSICTSASCATSI